MFRFVGILFLLLGSLSASHAADSHLLVHPATVKLTGTLDRVQLVVHDASKVIDCKNCSGLVDVTRDVKFTAPRSLATVTKTGVIKPVGNGSGNLRVALGKRVVDIPIEVGGCDSKPAIDFSKDIIPVFSKAGCNQGACHASQYGKGEFKLSLFGFAPEQDHPELVRDWRSRRLSFVQPERSLILKKATLEVSHGGGQRFRKGSWEHHLLLEWIKGGASGPSKTAAHVVELLVHPSEKVYQGSEQQQLNVTAKYDDGTERDVTHLAIYDSMGEGVAVCSSSGLVEAIGPGQAPIMIRFQGQAKVSNVLVPHRDEVDLTKFTPNNFIDQHVKRHWQLLGLQPSAMCSDEFFIRRAFIDCIGTLPTPEKIEAFVSSKAPDKREQLVDELLGLTGDSKRDVYTNEWSSYWALKWGDLLRNNRNKVGDGGMWAFHNWIKQSLRENKPVDKFVQEIITAQGSIYANGPANYFKIVTKPEDLAETTAQVFLGIRMQCAKCHHHPFEVYSQADYYGLAAFFTRVATKTSTDFGALGRDSIIMLRNTGSISHPRTRKPIAPTPLGAEPVAIDNVRDLRRPLAEWLTAKQNKLFARNIVNRFWGYFMSTGLVEPIDDMRATNPPSIPSLLDALAADFVESEFDLKRLMRNIMTSRVYQLSSTPRRENVSNTRMYLHYNVKRLSAEVMLDAIDDACGTRERFTGVPLGTRAIDLPDSNYASYFLDTTGRPKRVIACECERTSEPNLAAVLHIANGDILQNKIISKTGRIARLIKEQADDDSAITELYLVTFSRRPTQKELDYAREFLQDSKSRQQALEDLLWALINSREFLFNH